MTRAATITDAATGAWSMPFIGGDLTQAGLNAVELEVVFSSGEVQTFALAADSRPVQFLTREQYA